MDNLSRVKPVVEKAEEVIQKIMDNFSRMKREVEKVEEKLQIKQAILAKMKLETRQDAMTNVSEI